MKPLKRRRIRIDAVYDIECADWTQFVCGAHLSASGQFELFSEHKSAPSHLGQEAMASHIIAHGGHTWAHSGGTYDHKWLIDIAARRGHFINISAAGARIVTAQIGKLALRDSWALCPVSLKGLTEGQGIHKEELGLPCICAEQFHGEECGGYCSIARDMPTHLYNRLCEYLRADCYSLFEALEKFQAFADDNDIDLCATVGSSAWRTIKRWLGVPDANMSASEHQFVRNGYYGGRVQNPQPGEHRNFHEFDVSSMYPWSMSHFAMPWGEHVVRHGSEAKRAFLADKAGFYDVTVDVPEMPFPPLPHRADKRIAYPTGRFRGTWALPELQKAVSLGVRIVDIAEAITWNDTRVIFPDFVNSIFALRDKAGKKTPIGTCLKFLLNAPTGKFGSNPEKEHWFVNPQKLNICPGSKPCRLGGLRDCGECCDTHCTRRCESMTPHSDYIWSEYVYKLDSCAHIEWAGYLTSNARVETLSQILSADPYKVIYLDTDGVQGYEMLTRRVGNALGEWQYQGTFQYGHFIAPKTYYRIDAEGKTTAKAKGLGAPKDKPIILGETYKPKGVAGLKQGAKLGTLFTPNYALREGRKVQYSAGDRILLPDGKTRAPTIDECEGRDLAAAS